MAVIIEEGTPLPESTAYEITYTQYAARGIARIWATAWASYLAEAKRVVNDLTQGSYLTATDAAIIETVTDALCRVANALYAAETGVASESIGSYSYSKGEAATYSGAITEGRRALGSTGLLYMGIAHVTPLVDGVQW